ncbi:MAG TPA: YkgJ family cysteine cluster protein [Candidatus Gastranaerophilales bacterium]|nr:YkgJ family cysteine cluster protein [Candidatus Gastranaerophilales bacterium]
MDMQLERYIALLTALMPTLDQFFEIQKDYIKCKIGCSHCCQRGYYPVTNVEAKLIKACFENIEDCIKAQIVEKAEKINIERALFVANGNDILNFKYTCPFLAEDKCSIYEYRPIICRTQGLIFESALNPNKFNMPACVFLGLNYANVYDEQTNTFSDKKIKDLNLQTPPLALDFCYESLVELCGIDPKTLGEKIIDPGNDEIRMIFEWAL